MPVLAVAGARSRRLTWEEIESEQVDLTVFMPCGFDLDGAVAQAPRSWPVRTPQASAASSRSTPTHTSPDPAHGWSKGWSCSRNCCIHAETSKRQPAPDCCAARGFDPFEAEPGQRSRRLPGPLLGLDGGHTAQRPVARNGVDPHRARPRRIAKDGGVFASGDAACLGSLGGSALGARRRPGGQYEVEVALPLIPGSGSTDFTGTTCVSRSRSRNCNAMLRNRTRAFDLSCTSAPHYVLPGGGTYSLGFPRNQWHFS